MIESSRGTSVRALPKARNKVAAAAARIALLCGFCAVLALSGCSSSKRFARPEAEPAHVPGAAPSPAPAPAPPEPSASRYYDYHAVTDQCDCAEYSVTDPAFRISYQMHARYKMDRGIQTEIEIRIENRAADTLFIDNAAAKVSSKNLAYDYNDKFLPLPIMVLPPGESNSFTLSGRDKGEENDWHKIAGEQLTVTLKGLRNSSGEIPARSVAFVPENPMLRKQ